MKKIMSFIAIVFLNFVSYTAFSQNNDEPEALGLPGDNLNLYAVLDVFQKSKTLEDFEKSINSEENKINNLDLNNDDKTDYIQVNSEKKDDTFFVILQVSVGKTEKQDVAVIEVDRDKNGKVNIQVIGDEELYGKDYILEPSQNETVGGTANPGFNQGNTTIINNNTTNNYTTNNNSDDFGPRVSAWPIVLYMFSPLFIPWRSPWYWGYYPSYWRPWRPYYYRTYWGYHRRYYASPYYRRSNYYRNRYYRTYYNNRRVYSNTVRRYKSDNRYRGTYQGQVYKRPNSGIVRPGSYNRPTVGNRYPNATRPGASNRYPNTSTRPGSSNNRYPNATRPGSSNQYPNVTKPNNSNSRPTTYPSTRPATRPSSTWPSTRPSNHNPISWPSSSSSRPMTRPTTRPSSGSMSRPSSMNRASRGGGRS